MSRLETPRLLAVAGAPLGLFAGCGGESDDAATPAAPAAAPTTTDVSTVADGAIKGATVFLDKTAAASVTGTGNSSCQDRSNASFFACTVTITIPATGAFTYADATGTASGSFVGGCR